jgi:hypothetical protein
VGAEDLADHADLERAAEEIEAALPEPNSGRPLTPAGCEAAYRKAQLQDGNFFRNYPSFRYLQRPSLFGEFEHLAKLNGCEVREPIYAIVAICWTDTGPARLFRLYIPIRRGGWHRSTARHATGPYAAEDGDEFFNRLFNKLADDPEFLKDYVIDTCIGISRSTVVH